MDIHEPDVDFRIFGNAKRAIRLLERHEKGVKALSVIYTFRN